MGRTLVFVVLGVVSLCTILAAASFALTAEREPERGTSNYCRSLEAEIYFFEGPETDLTEQQQETLHAWRTDCAP